MRNARSFELVEVLLSHLCVSKNGKAWALFSAEWKKSKYDHPIDNYDILIALKLYKLMRPCDDANAPSHLLFPSQKTCENIEKFMHGQFGHLSIRHPP